MTDWKQLANEISRWLNGFGRDGLQFYPCTVPGWPGNGFKSDGILTDGRTLLALEVEAKQMNPDTNVGKYWFLARRYSPKFAKIVLFHVFTPLYDSYPYRKALGEFYAECMKEDVSLEYVQLDYRKATDYEKTLAEVQERIEQRVRSEFPFPSAAASASSGH